MKDWFDEWLNTPGPPEDNDKDGYYYFNDLNENEEPPPTVLQELGFLAIATALAAIVGVFALLIATVITLSIISLILHHQILQWLTALTLTALALHWANNKTRK